MKKSIFTLFILQVIILLLSPSCSKDQEFLETKPSSEYTDVALWQSAGLIQSFIDGIYADTYGYPLHFIGVGLSNYSGDECWFNQGLGVSDFNKCQFTAEYIPLEYADYLPRFLWDALYGSVRKINLLFENEKNMNIPEASTKSRLIGEAFFLRALLYHRLTSMYGGVPIITKVYGLNDDFSITRSSYAECVKFIEDQLDSAALYLPLEYQSENFGRATKGAAMALKARVLLYAASDLHHNISSYAGGFANPELLGYVGVDRTNLWQKAKDAAKAVIDLNQYSLYKADPDPGDSIAQNIEEYFLSKSATNEDILLRDFTPKSGSSWTNYEPYTNLYPNGYHGWGDAQPFADLVDAYERKDGSNFDWTNPLHSVSPYEFRDARFYATILYEGSPFSFRTSDVQTIDPFDRMQTGIVEYLDDDENQQTLRGADAGLIDDWSNGVYTGYFLRKFLDPKNDYTKQKQEIPFRLMRYAEVLLNYAEACIELGEDEEARFYINMVRKRAGQPPITESGSLLKERYRKERRIELAFEDHRFFDVRRWIAGPSAYHTVHRTFVKYSTMENVTNYYKPDGTYWSEPIYTQGIVDEYAWDDKAYFFPIWRNEINKNNLLIQNPGY